MSIVDGTGAVVAEYEYDPYGNILSTTGTLADTLGQINPLRYRGYVYDSECNLYYLQSRYYDPSIGRFLNADAYASTGQGIIGHNMFAYCGNNPVRRIDAGGNTWYEDAWEWICDKVKKLFGAEGTTTSTIHEEEVEIIPDPSPITVTTSTSTTRTVSSTGDSSKFISVYADGNTTHPIKSSSAGMKINLFDFTLDFTCALDDFGIYGRYTDGNKTHSVGATLNLSELKIGLEGSTATSSGDYTHETSTNASVNGWGILAILAYIYTGSSPTSSPYPAYG